MSYFTGFPDRAQQKSWQLRTIANASHSSRRDGRESCLIASDAQLSYPAMTAVPLGFVKEQMRQSKATKRVLIVDDCHSDEGKSSGQVGEMLRLNTDPKHAFANGRFRCVQDVQQ